MNETPATSSVKGLWWYIATWFGTGHSPIVSGTVGSAAALPFAYVIQMSFGNFGLWIAAFIIFAIGCWASNEFLRHNPDKQDPGEIVVDEVAGQWLTLTFFPLTWQGYLTAFILFRIFDIIKPWPVSWADRKVKGGLGVMLDDLLAGAYPVAIILALSFIATISGGLYSLQPFYDFIYGN